MAGALSSRRVLWLSVVLVLWVGAALRLIQITQYPPGFHYDEAVNFIVAREIAEYGARPFPVFAAFNGREVFYFYVNAVAMVGIGQHIFTMHVVSMMMNWITLATTIGLGHALFGRGRGVVIGLLAAGVMAVSFPQIFIARQAFRAVSLPMLQALCLWALFVGLRRQRRWWLWLACSGALGAMTLYTYMASRLFPGWVALVLLALWINDRERRRQRLVQGALVMGVLLVIALPIIKYYLDNPDVFADRLDQLSAGEGDTPSYLESVRLHLEMFFIEGDPYIRYNEPFAPYFDPLTGVLLMLGLGVSVWGAFRADDALTRTAYLIVACAPLMVVPSVLAVGGLPPSHMRSIGMVPLIFFLPAIGINFLWMHVVQIRWPQRLESVIVAWGVLLLMGLWVWGRYEEWAANPELFYLTDGDMVEAGEWLEEQSDGDTLMYITSLHYDHPSLQMHDLPGDNITFLLGDRVFLPPPDREAYLIETTNAPLPVELRAVTTQFESPYQGKGFLAYFWSPQPPNGTAVGETIGGWLSLQGVELPRAIAGESATVISQWRIVQSPAYDDLTPIVQLETPYGDVLARDEPYTQRSTHWRPGEVLYQQAHLSVPMGTPPGDYPVRVTWVGRAADQYVGRLDERGSFAGVWTQLGTLTVMSPETFPAAEALDMSHQAEIEIMSGLRLLGWDDIPDAIRPGEELNLNLYWQAHDGERPTDAMRILADTTLLWEGAPVMNSYPFEAWRPGELVVDRHRWPVPTDLTAGEYQLNVQVGQQAITIGRFTVLEVNRQFEAPVMAHTVNLDVGDVVRLLGYDYQIDGDTLQLTLYWQSLAQTDLPLTVFVHVVGADGSNYDQVDAQPREYTYPVSLWVPGEVVEDPYSLNLPTTTYQVNVGMYLQATGQRLSMTSSDGEVVGDMWTVLESEDDDTE